MSFSFHPELERSLEQRIGHQVRDVQDAFSRKGSIAKEIGDYPTLIQEANTVPVLVVPRLEEGTSDYLVRSRKIFSQLLGSPKIPILQPPVGPSDENRLFRSRSL